MMRLLSILCAALLLPLTGCDSDFQYDEFDPGIEGIVDVVTEAFPPEDGDSSDVEAPEIYYYTLASGRRLMPAEPFEPDAASVYRVTDASPNSQGGEASGALSDRLIDGQGAPVRADAEIQGVLNRLHSLEHEPIAVEIYAIGGEYFVYAELNVNLWDPCDLYYYDPETDDLTLLYEWDSERVIGLRVRDIDNLNR